MNGITIVLIAFVVIGLPVVLGVGSEMLKTWTRHQRDMAEALGHQTAERAAQYAAQVERLEQRMRVLERIVTDKGIDLSDEIERLRLQSH